MVVGCLYMYIVTTNVRAHWLVFLCCRCVFPFRILDSMLGSSWVVTGSIPGIHFLNLLVIQYYIFEVLAFRNGRPCYSRKNLGTWTSLSHACCNWLIGRLPPGPPERERHRTSRTSILFKFSVLMVIGPAWVIEFQASVSSKANFATDPDQI